MAAHTDYHICMEAALAVSGNMPFSVLLHLSPLSWCIYDTGCGFWTPQLYNQDAIPNRFDFGDNTLCHIASNDSNTT